MVPLRTELNSHLRALPAKKKKKKKKKIKSFLGSRESFLATVTRQKHTKNGHVMRYGSLCKMARPGSVRRPAIEDLAVLALQRDSVDRHDHATTLYAVSGMYI